MPVLVAVVRVVIDRQAFEPLVAQRVLAAQLLVFFECLVNDLRDGVVGPSIGPRCGSNFLFVAGGNPRFPSVVLSPILRGNLFAQCPGFGQALDRRQELVPCEHEPIYRVRSKAVLNCEAKSAQGLRGTDCQRFARKIEVVAHGMRLCDVRETAKLINCI